jgi:spermidine/putrescine transport system ATP-binding protein
VRPEFVELSADRPAGTENVAAGEVIGVSHLGEMLQFLVQLDENTAVLSRRPTPDAPRLAVGDRVWASWRADAVQVFPAGDTAARSGYVPPPTVQP